MIAKINFSRCITNKKIIISPSRSQSVKNKKRARHKIPKSAQLHESLYKRNLRNRLHLPVCHTIHNKKSAIAQTATRIHPSRAHPNQKARKRLSRRAAGVRSSLSGHRSRVPFPCPPTEGPRLFFFSTVKSFRAVLLFTFLASCLPECLQ